jgi:hypothetical protein
MRVHLVKPRAHDQEGWRQRDSPTIAYEPYKSSEHQFAFRNSHQVTLSSAVNN